MDLNIDWLWTVFIEIGATLVVILTKMYEGLMWGYNTVSAIGGAGAGFLFIMFILVFIPFLAINKSISSTQAFFEAFQASLAVVFIKIVGVVLLTFTILFVLSQV